MRELILRVRAAELEEALDAILPELPGGAHVGADGELAEIRILEGPAAPDAERLSAVLGERLVEAREDEVADDWRERRLARYEPLTIAGRFVVRPEWAPAPADGSLLDIALVASSAFGSGVHPTTQACLAALAAHEPRGSLLDCGCGSGVLSIGAARLGWSPVIAVDVVEESVQATAANAELNGVELDVRGLDLTAEPPPEADVLVANVPPPIHMAIAPALERVPRLAVISGFQSEEVEAVAAAWADRGLETTAHRQVAEWSLLVLE